MSHSLPVRVRVTQWAGQVEIEQLYPSVSQSAARRGKESLYMKSPRSCFLVHLNIVPFWLCIEESLVAPRPCAERFMHSYMTS